MNYKTFLSYLKSIEIIEARKALLDIQISSFPHLSKAADRKKTLRELRQMAFNNVDKGRGNLKSYSEVVANIARKLGRG